MALSGDTEPSPEPCMMFEDNSEFSGKDNFMGLPDNFPNGLTRE